MKGSSGKSRAGAVRKSKGKQVGSGGQGRQALEGKGPTPKAEDRAWENYIRARRYRAGQEYTQLTARLHELAGPGASILAPPVYWIGFTVIAVLVALGGVQTALLGRGRSLLPWIRYREQTA